MTENKLISVIYVNYNTTTLIEESIQSLKKQPYKNYQIGIVDNSPGTKEYNKLRQVQDRNRDLRIELFKPKYNLEL